MPVDMKRYPENWTEISHRIRFERAGGRCECSGECGTHDERCDALHGEAHPLTGSKVVLTTAHLGADTDDKHDKMDVRAENLKAMCQRGHLLFDLDEHKLNASISRRKKIIDAGQMEMKLESTDELREEIENELAQDIEWLKG
jgi:hypothetical protein